MNYKKIKREQIDRCNICGEKSMLTWDHVPPKCCNNRYRIKTNSLINGLPQENKYESQYQNEIRFRSLCEKCNNYLLGTKYDTVLADFTNQVTNITTSSIINTSSDKHTSEGKQISKGDMWTLFGCKKLL